MLYSVIGYYSLILGLFTAIILIYFSIKNFQNSELLDTKILSFSFLQFFLVVISFLCLILPCVILLNQPDVGQTVLLTFSWVAVVFISGIKIIYIFTLFGIAISSIASLLFLFPDKFAYVFRRLEVFFDPSKGDRVQSSKALDAIKEGGLTGQGMGEGTLKYRVPEAHTDYIISVISEEFGSIISILIVCIFLYITFRVIKFALSENDKFIKRSLK